MREFSLVISVTMASSVAVLPSPRLLMATRATSQPPVGAFRRRATFWRLPPLFLTLSWIVVGLVFFCAIFTTWLEPYPPQEQDLLAANQPPSPEH